MKDNTNDNLKAKRDIEVFFDISHIKGKLHFRRMASGVWIYVVHPMIDMTYKQVIEGVDNLVQDLCSGDIISIYFDGEDVTEQFLKETLDKEFTLS